MATKKSTTKKAATSKVDAPSKAAQKMNIRDYLRQLEDEEGDEEVGGKIRNILKLFIKGYTRKEIIEAGFNKTTVYRQTGEYNKLKKGPALQYYGYEVYESRIQRLMKAKGMSRAKAVEALAEIDMIAIAKKEEGVK